MFRDDELAAGDCLECLLAIGSASDKGREALVQQKVLTTVIHRLSEATPSTLSSPWILLLIVLHILFMIIASSFPGNPTLIYWFFGSLVAWFSGVFSLSLFMGLLSSVLNHCAQTHS